MNSREVAEFYHKLIDLQMKYVGRLADGEISVDRFLSFCRKLDRAVENSCQTFSTFEGFEAYMRDRYPQIAEKHISHEREHRKCAVRHGLTRYTFGVVEAETENIPVFFTFHSSYLGENCVGWPRENILEYLRETLLRIRKPSYGDRKIAQNLK